MFPYVPIYSLPINPHSALVLPAVRMHPDSHEINLPTRS